MADQCRVSATALIAASEECSYVFNFKIQGYSRAKELFKNGECVASPPFSLGGYSWVLRYRPNRRLAGQVSYTQLVLDSDDAKYVKAQPRFTVLDKDGVPVKQLSGFIQERIFPIQGASLGLLMDQASSGQSEHLVDDCLSIRCDLTLIKDVCGEETVGDQFVVVPPSDLHRHFGNLLESMVGADVTFHVGGKKFLAHRFVLAARSSVFEAELLGVMKENVGSPIVIHEMEPDVFKFLLHFIYTDSLPVLEFATDQGEAVVMAGHLLVAADRYNVERLKLICEHKLCSHIDANMVATSLALAEQHSCHGLKEACLQFLSSPSNLKAMMASDGYEHLKTSCPSALKDLIVRLLPVEMEVAKDIVMAI
jgi:speckle-type POZ protein